MMTKDTPYNKISDLLFLADAIDLPYYDFVVGVESLNPNEGVAYNHGEGELLKSKLLALDRKTILHLSHQPSPPKDAPSNLLKGININHVVAAIGIAIIDPHEPDNQIHFIPTPVEFLDEVGVVKECPEKLLDMLKQRLVDFT